MIDNPGAISDIEWRQPGTPEDHKPIQVTLKITGIRQKYIKQNKPIQNKTQLHDKQQLQQTIQAIQIMKQQLTQRNPNSD